jgi:hypothetical protein
VLYGNLDTSSKQPIEHTEVRLPSKTQISMTKESVIGFSLILAQMVDYRLLLINHFAYAILHFRMVSEMVL